MTPVGASLLWVVFLAVGSSAARAARGPLGLARPWALAAGAAAGALAVSGAYRAHYGRPPSRRTLGFLLVVWATLLFIGWGAHQLTTDLQ